MISLEDRVDTIMYALFGLHAFIDWDKDQMYIVNLPSKKWVTISVAMAEQIADEEVSPTAIPGLTQLITDQDTEEDNK